MRTHAADQVEEDLFEAAAAPGEAREGNARREGDAAEFFGFATAHHEPRAQRVELELRGGEGGRQRRAVGRIGHDDGLLAARELVEAALVDEAPPRDDQHAVDGLLHLGEQVRREQHGAPLGGQRAQQAADPLDALRIETVHGLVEHEHARVAEQGAGEAEPLTHPEREPADLAIGDRLEPHHRERLVDARERQPRRLRHDSQVIVRGARGVKAGCLERGAHRAQRVLQLGVRNPADRGRALARAHEAEQDAQRRRLARAVGTEKARHHARLDARRDALDGGHRAEALGEPREFEDLSFGHVSASRRGCGPSLSLPKAARVVSRGRPRRPG